MHCQVAGSTLELVCRTELGRPPVPCGIIEALEWVGPVERGWLVKATASGAVFSNILVSIHVRFSPITGQISDSWGWQPRGALNCKTREENRYVLANPAVHLQVSLLFPEHCPWPFGAPSGLCHHYWDSLAFSDVAPSIQMKLSLLGGTT